MKKCNGKSHIYQNNFSLKKVNPSHLQIIPEFIEEYVDINASKKKNNNNNNNTTTTAANGKLQQLKHIK